MIRKKSYQPQYYGIDGIGKNKLCKYKMGKNRYLATLERVANIWIV